MIGFCFLIGLAACLLVAHANAAEQGKVLSAEGKVEHSRQRAAWTNALAGQKLEAQDRLRTLKQSRAMVQLAELGRVRLDEQTTLEIYPPRNSKSKGTLDLKAGAMYFFTRDRPREFEIKTPQALAASRGTEFLVAIDGAGRETFMVFDGEVEITNSLGGVVLAPGEQGVVDPGQAPRKTAVIQGTRIVQWWLYYAAVVDLRDLTLNQAQQTALATSLDSYRQGDLLQALANYPEGRSPENSDEQIFNAALLLSVGRVVEAEALLTNANSSVARALRVMMDTVQNRPVEPIAQPQTATEWVVQSYVFQSRYDLAGALAAARKAAEVSPEFAFAWARVAELEFSFGRTREANAALEKSLALAPRNAQAWALQGFLLSARRKWQASQEAFDRAIALDPALGNGWLGRGLVAIRQGKKTEGRADLQTAAALEPNRSLLRSYLGKGFDHDHDEVNAQRELTLAKELDASDPTPWLYSALILRQQLRYNEAVTELEKSSELNDDRRVYRSRFMLDQDQAVRSASLATIYRGAGMNEVSVREAARAVNNDYANYSAHQFLAESYDALRDPTRFNLRTETVWFNELLLANMLAPVGAGNLSQNISQQEYSRLFATDRLGFSSMTEYRSDDQTREVASQFGTIGNFSYALDLDWQHNAGVRPNNELDRTEIYATAKYQLTAKDSLFLLMKYQDYESGDNFQYYDPSATITDTNLAPFNLVGAPIIRTNFSFREKQSPIAVAGYHREWAPGVHTLFLGGRLENQQKIYAGNSILPIITRDVNGQVTASQYFPFNVELEHESEIYTAELNQIFQSERQLLILGARYQSGTFDAEDLVTLLDPNDPNYFPFFNSPPASADFSADFERITGYGYYTLEVLPNLRLTGGLAYDRVKYPDNFRDAPTSDGEETKSRLSPKAALVWSPRQEVTVRGVYTRSLGGVSVDDSFRLEPAQLAGFSQSFRTLIPESVAGSVSAPTYETAGAALDLKFKTRTYVGLQAEYLKSQVHRDIGVFDFNGVLPPPPSMSPSSLRQHLEFTEPSATVTVNQLLSDWWSFGAQYRYTRSKLETELPEITPAVDPGANHSERADLHHVRASLLFNHPSGFFAGFDSNWYQQKNRGYSGAMPGDDFFQHNLQVGYRLKRQRGDITFGVLNLADTDYKLNPLNAYSELPRERVFMVRLRINF